MSDLSGYTHKFRANGDFSTPNGVNKVSKRNRQPVSCAPCRSKKLKCDRGHPCETCVKRGDEASCFYGNSTRASFPQGDGAGRRAQAQYRLRNLENLVMQMMSANQSKSGDSSLSPNPADALIAAAQKLSPSDGHMLIEGNEARYVGSTHWSAILDNINELKSVIATENVTMSNEQEEEREAADQDTIFGGISPPPLERVLQQYLPPRLQVDRRLAAYFDAKYMVIPIIHTYQFQRQYERFWADPLNTPPLWIAILFSILCLSASISGAAGSEPPTLEGLPTPQDNFLVAAAQCLVLGGYTRPRKFVVEALLLFSQCKYMATFDPSREVSVIFCIITRMAFRMGYHRDPDHFSHFSKFEGEMRRRTWAMCKQFDLMIAFQLGLPCNIPTDSYDTNFPRNYLDADIDEFMTELPPSRPESEVTQILYFVVKSRLMDVFAKVCRTALAFGNPEESDIMSLDAEVRRMYELIPSCLRIKTMSQSIADPAHLIMVRVNCEFIFQKSICVLHRKRMAQGNSFSRRVCLDAAQALMSHLIDLNTEFQPGGRLYADRWMLSSFTMNDFLLAAMVLVLALTTAQKIKQMAPLTPDDTSQTQARDHLTLLNQAHAICQEWGGTSKEAKHVADALGIMLTKLRPMLGLQEPSMPTPLSPPQQLEAPFATGNGNFFPLDQFGDIVDGTVDLDWTVFDQYLNIPNNFEDAGQGWSSTPYSFMGMPQGNAREKLGERVRVLEDRGKEKEGERDRGNSGWTF